MDADSFDRLAKAFFRSDTRRRLIGLLTTAPILGALSVLLDPEEGEAGHPVNRVLRRKKQRRRKARKERRKRRRQQRQDQNQPDGGDGGGGGDLGSGTCVPLNQSCLPQGNPCCEDEADCLITIGGELPVVGACVDKSKEECTSDADCRKRFKNPNIACYKRGPFTCRKGVEKCCHPRTCDRDHPCEDAKCCSSFASGLKEVCCGAPSQDCNPLTGCVDF